MSPSTCVQTIHQWVDAKMAVYDCPLFIVVHTDSKCTVISGCEDNWKCPPGLSQFNDYQFQHLGDVILPELHGFGSSTACGRGN